MSGPAPAGPRPVRPLGPRAALVECADLHDAVAVHARLAAADLPGLVDCVAGAETVVVRTSTTDALRGVVRAARAVPRGSAGAGGARTVTIDVVYDGEDLEAVGELTGLGADGVVRFHTGQAWTAAFAGFAPGFFYCVGEDGPDVPRRGTPRTAVPAGSVALAGRFSAVYPRSSPGGWQLIGRSAARMFDLDREDPALLRPGDRVRYRPVRELVEVAAAPAGTAPVRGPHLTVGAPGLQTLVQDGGRAGSAALGVSPSGALDAAAAGSANRLVGNGPGAAVLEHLLGGLELTAHGEHVLAVTGARAALTVTGPAPWRPPPGTPFALRDGERLAVGTVTAGARVYVGVRGGIAVPPVLGSRSADTLAGLGPAPLAAGDALPVGPDPGTAVRPPEPAPAPAAVPAVRVVPGPRDDWFTPAAVASFFAQEWELTASSDRVGARLSGEPLERVRTDELPSEGTVPGCVQVPPAGLPVVLLQDAPTTGGYPVIGVVHPEDLAVLAQLRPGGRLRFVRLPAPDLGPPPAEDPEPATARAEPDSTATSTSTDMSTDTSRE
ncbi:5-oxoprolinase subunit B/C family protein [Kocuria rosea]|uniref:5-oxoprolinase subunit B/C family protein n=1 Tax=Kocuria rosea TaxID=1275 RepID=UPI00119DEAF9|nr:5-oxoprolinase/urea amidolyase family protein [Kocuria rosea]WJZ66209.1 5-oxoprolinase/urea amidolyase family protein [Kocuria rosea]